MFECSLFGIIDKKFEWNCKKYTRTEKIYTANQKKAVVCIEADGISCVFYDAPDKNKQRTAVVSKVSKTKLNKQYHDILCALGYIYVKTNSVEGFLYNRIGYDIELSRPQRKQAETMINSNESTVVGHSTPVFHSDSYLIKVFLTTKDIAEGENILQTACIDLIDEVPLIKVNLSALS